MPSSFTRHAKRKKNWEFFLQNFLFVFGHYFEIPYYIFLFLLFITKTDKKLFWETRFGFLHCRNQGWIFWQFSKIQFFFLWRSSVTIIITALAVTHWQQRKNWEKERKFDHIWSFLTLFTISCQLFSPVSTHDCLTSGASFRRWT